jgi:hypothetical protein
VTTTVAAILSTSGLHAKQIESLAHAVVGAVHAAQAGIAHLGRAAAGARRTDPKHGIKQVDRMLSNPKLEDEKACRAYVRHVLGGRKRVVTTLDWTEYAEDGQHRIALNRVTRHGRATPLLWKTVTDEELTGKRNGHEDALLRLFKRLLPETVQEVILLADRGFADVALYDMLRGELGFYFIIRFRQGMKVRDEEGHAKYGRDWVPPNGRARLLPNARVTGKRHCVQAVVAVKKRGMKEAWLLAAHLPEKARAEAIVSLYAKRFSCEENFRDEKDPRFGLGTLNVRLSSPARRDRLLLVLALACVLLTLLGAAGEALGLDKRLRANTLKKPRRTHSLFRQGREYMRGVFGKGKNVLRRLRRKFLRLLSQHASSQEVYAWI